MLKKVVAFITSINDGTISEEDYNEFRYKLETDYEYGQKVAEKLLVMIDRQVDVIQTRITANLFKAYVRNELTFEELSHMLLSLNSHYPLTYEYFAHLEQRGYKAGEETAMED